MEEPREPAPYVLVAGGMRGIGRAISRGLVARGYRVLGVYRRDVVAAETEAAIGPGLRLVMA